MRGLGTWGGGVGRGSRRAKPGRFGSLAFAMKNTHFGRHCSWILGGKALKCGIFWVFACVPNPGKQSIWRQYPPSARKQSTKKTAKSSRFCPCTGGGIALHKTCCACAHERDPKDPTVLKILRRSKFTTHSKFTMRSEFTMATTPALTQFSWVLQENFPSKRGSRRSKSGGRSENTAA